MIFGATRDELWAEEQKRREKLAKGWWKFAWFPIILEDGRGVWLQKVFVKPDLHYSYGSWFWIDSHPTYKYYLKP